MPYIVAAGDDIESLKLIAPNEVGHGIFTDNAGQIYVYLGGEHNPTTQAISAASVIMTQMETGRQVNKIPKGEIKKGVEEADDLTIIATEIGAILDEIHEGMESEEE